MLAIVCQSSFLSFDALADKATLVSGDSEAQEQPWEQPLEQWPDGQPPSRQKRSVNGTPDSGRWYWMVKVVKSSTAQPCTGIPLNARWVLTAAHCTTNETAGVLAIDYTANLGEQTEDEIATAIRKHSQALGSTITVKRIVKHPKSKAAKLDKSSGVAPTQRAATTYGTTSSTPDEVGVNDVALLELNAPLPPEIINVTPPLHFNKVDIKPRLKATMGGYGDGYGTNQKHAPHYYTSILRRFKDGHLKTLSLPVKKKVNRGKVNSGPKRCKRLLPAGANGRIMICDTGAPFPSNGDSGGPLVSKNMIVGSLYGGDTYPNSSFMTNEGAAVFEMKRANFEPLAYHKHFITSYAGLHWNDHKSIPAGQNFSPLLHYRMDNPEIPAGAVCRARNTDGNWSYGIMIKDGYRKDCRFNYFHGTSKDQKAQVYNQGFQIASGWKNQNEADARIVWKKLHKKHLTSPSATPIAIDYDANGNPLYLCALIGNENDSAVHLDNGEFGVISKHSKRCKIGNKGFRNSPGKNRSFWVLSIESSAAGH